MRCARCGSRFPWRDEDGDLRCLLCCRTLPAPRRRRRPLWHGHAPHTAATRARIAAARRRWCAGHPGPDRQGEVVRLLRARGQLQSRHIAAALGVSPQHAVRLLGQLIAAGLVVRCASWRYAAAA